MRVRGPARGVLQGGIRAASSAVGCCPAQFFLSSSFSTGGSTILTVQVKKVNLPDGTVLNVTLDFTPIGSLTLTGGQGSMQADLGHFGVSRDQVRVKNGDTVILQGGFFQ